MYVFNDPNLVLISPECKTGFKMNRIKSERLILEIFELYWKTE